MSTADDAQRWLPYRKAQPAPRLRLFCLPNAGGAASAYRAWERHGLPAGVELCAVQLPGRESRLRETPFRRAEPLVAALAEAIRDLLDVPFVVFGHSMGTILGFELAHRLRDLGLPAPRHLVMSGRRAPHLADEDPIHRLPDPELVERLRGYGGTPPEILAHPELMALVLPILRADFELVETHVVEHGRPALDLPITVLGGRDDDATRGDLDAWRELTNGSCQVRMFPGGHFFVHSAMAEVLAFLGPLLDSAAR